MASIERFSGFVSWLSYQIEEHPVLVQITLISPPSPYRDTPDPNGLPLGLVMLATMIRDDAEVEIIDAYSRALPVNETITIVLVGHPDIVGISMPFSFSEGPGLAIAEGLKSVRPELRIILGGVQATTRCDELLSNASVDAVALGEAEMTAIDLLKGFTDGGWSGVLDNLPAGLRARKETGNFAGEHRPLIEDLDVLPFPDFGFLPGFPENYAARLLTSRGCSYNCPYCASVAFWKRKFRPHSPGRVVDEVRTLRDKWGVRRVSFSDDTFNLNPERAREIAELFLKADLGVEWGASCRPELLNEDDLRLYVRAGMTGLYMGLESGSPRILETIRRGHDLDRTRQLIEIAENLGVEVHASFMIGLPEEREEDIERTLDYARSLPASTLGCHIFHPLPGSEYGENPEKYGIEFEIQEGQVTGLGEIDAVAPINTKYMSSMRILDYYHQARGIAEEKLRQKDRD